VILLVVGGVLVRRVTSPYLARRDAAFARPFRMNGLVETTRPTRLRDLGCTKIHGARGRWPATNSCTRALSGRYRGWRAGSEPVIDRS
jgi:hypothetical protein